jgi:hypothetical protein
VGGDLPDRFGSVTQAMSRISPLHSGQVKGSNLSANSRSRSSGHRQKWALCVHSKCLNGRPEAAVQAGSEARSNLCLLGDFKGIVDFDAEVTHGAFQLEMAQQELHGSEVLRSPIDQRRFGST